MVLLEFIAISWLILWSFFIIFAIQYYKNVQNISENQELPELDIKVSHVLQKMLSDAEDNILKKINLGSLKDDVITEMKSELALFKTNLFLLVDELESKMKIQLPDIKLPDMSIFQSKIDEFQVPEIANIKNEIKTEIANAFSDENIDKIAQSVLKTLSENMKDGKGEVAENMNLENLDINNIIKMFAMQYLGKFMPGGGGQGSGPAPAISSGPSTGSVF